MDFSRLRFRKEKPKPGQPGMKPVALIGPEKPQVREVHLYWLDSLGKHHPGKLTLIGGPEPRIKLEGALDVPLDTPGRK